MPTEINVVVNIDTAGDKPKVTVKPPMQTNQNRKHNLGGGVLQFPEAAPNNNPILDLLNIKET